jgi:hypothetical protein
MDANPKLPVLVQNKLRTKHYRCRTEQQSLASICCFILHHGKRHSRDMLGPEVEQFLTHLAVEVVHSAAVGLTEASVAFKDAWAETRRGSAPSQ